jgi:anaerobic selenocysteine-containing dehydrogenase
MTTRSHDQYNTTIYGMDDRYRGVFGLRRVIFINRTTSTCWASRMATTSIWRLAGRRRAPRRHFLLVAYDIPRGCVGAYYPETNPLVPLQSVADIAGTPTSKSIPVLLQPAKGGNHAKLRVL